jgi:xylan 1,4-beta-xylosidase
MAASELIVKPQYHLPRKDFKHTWKGLGNIDQMRWMGRKDCLQQLETAHKELGIKHIRAVGLFDDNLFVVGRDPKNFKNFDNGESRPNWQYIDYIFDELLGIGINPMFTTAFMPSALASGTQTVFDTRNNVTLPRSHKQWADLVSATLKHQEYRYGKNRMKDWYYEVWNEPNLNAFFGGEKEDFFKLWQTTWNAIKKVDPDFRVGGPSTARAEWIPEFLDFAKQNNCMPDYLIGHIYNNDSEYAALSPFSGPQQDKINRSPNFIGGVIRGVKEIAEDYNFKGEIHWNEWGRSWFPYDPLRETANEAAFIVKTLAEISQFGDYFAYWCLSDIYNQLGYGAETFHGNYGMVNLQGLKKPSYFAHQLLGEMENEKFSVETNSEDQQLDAIVTGDKTNLSAMVYSYDHDFQPQDESKTVRVKIELPGKSGITPEDIHLYRISKGQNNIVSEWENEDSPAYIRYDERTQWKNRNKLDTDNVNFNLHVNNDIPQLEFDMESPGITLVNIRLQS